MIVTAVKSTTLKSIAYDESAAVLRLEFRSRAVYDYLGVPATVHAALLLAPSIGACFNEMVRGCYPYCRLSASASDRAPKGTL